MDLLIDSKEKKIDMKGLYLNGQISAPKCNQILNSIV